MDLTDISDFISKDKIHSLLGIIPLISFWIFRVNFTILFFYTIFFGFFTFYLFYLSAFRRKIAEKIIQNDFFGIIKLIYSPFLFVLTLIIICIGFIYSSILSIININQSEYAPLLFLAHLFLFSFLLILNPGLKYASKLARNKK